jgi:Domain of unknown function (DUF4129)
MTRGRPWLCLLSGLTCVLTAAAQSVTPVTLDAYQKNLDRLNAVTSVCAQELFSQSPPNSCDPSAVGPDETVSFAQGDRRIGYEWLRATLRQAATAEKLKQDHNVFKLAGSALQDSSARLEQMIRQAQSPETGIYVPDRVADIRARLNAILQSGDYPQAKQPSLLERIWNAFVRWLLNAVLSAMPSGSSTSLLYLLEFAVIAFPCGLLIWWFVRRLRVQQLDLPQDGVLHPSTPSAQDWQQWLAQGETLGGEGRWREAIHHVYWGAISCLESRRFWPADRARTPREYLRLLDRNSEVHGDLFALTKSFEHTWYGETPAGEKDFLEASNVLKRMTAR